MSGRNHHPVIYMEHKELWGVAGEVDAAAGPPPLGKACVVREGSDITIVSWSSMVQICLASAAALAAQGMVNREPQQEHMGRSMAVRRNCGRG